MAEGKKKEIKKEKKNVELMILEMALIFVMNFLTFSIFYRIIKGFNLLVNVRISWSIKWVYY